MDLRTLDLIQELSSKDGVLAVMYQTGGDDPVFHTKTGDEYLMSMGSALIILAEEMLENGKSSGVYNLGDKIRDGSVITVKSSANDTATVIVFAIQGHKVLKSLAKATRNIVEPKNWSSKKQVQPQEKVSSEPAVTLTLVETQKPEPLQVNESLPGTSPKPVVPRDRSMIGDGRIPSLGEIKRLCELPGPV